MINKLTISASFGSSTNKANPTIKHILVVTEGFKISLAAGFHSPLTTLVNGVMNPDPFP